MTQKFRAKALDGRWLYPIDRGDVDVQVTNSRNAWENGVEFLSQTLPGYGNSQWFLLVPDGVTSAAYTWTKMGSFTGWRLDPDRVPEALKDTLPDYVEIEETRAVWSPYGMGDEGDWLAERWYSRQRGADDTVRVVIPLDEYEDFPLSLIEPLSVNDPAPDNHWLVNPAYLVFGAAFARGLPGELTIGYEELGKAIQSRIERAGLQVWSHEFRNGKFTGYVELPYSDGRTTTTTYQPPGTRAASKRVTSTRAAKKRVDFAFRLGNRFAGKDKAEAFNKLEAFIQGIVDEIAGYGVTVCAHCGGTGLTTTTK